MGPISVPAGRGGKRHLELLRSRLTSCPDQSNCRPVNTGAVKSKRELRRRTETESPSLHARRTPPPHAARSAADAATTPAPAPVAPAAGDGPAAAVLAALSAEPAGAAVSVIAARAGISVAAARQALLAHEKAGTATRVKGSRPGIADAWKPAAEPAGGTAGAGQPVPAPAGGTAEDQQAEAGTGPSPPRQPGALWLSRRPPTRPARPSRPGTCPPPWPPWRRRGSRQPRDGGRSRPPPPAGAPRRPGPGRCATWSRSTCASSPAPPSPRTRSARSDAAGDPGASAA